MKKIILITTMLISTISLLADYRLKEVQAYGKNGDNWEQANKEVYFYASNGNLLKKEISFLENGNFVIDRLVRYTSNSSNQIIKDTTIYLGGGWIDKEASAYIFSNGKLTQMNAYFLESGSTSWTFDMKTFYFYNSAQALNKEERDYHFSWGWQDEIRTNYFFESDSVTIKYKTVYDYTINRITSKFLYTYNNNLVSEIVRQKVNSDNSTVDEVKWVNIYEEYAGIDTPIENPSAELLSNYPNPFNPITTINFNLTKDADVNLTVYNPKGEIVKTLINGNLKSGVHTVNFSVGNLNSGVYFYKLTTPEKSVIKKMTLIK